MADIDLTTTAAVREFLQKSGSDTGQDDVIGSLVTRASTAISKHCDVSFQAASSSAKTFEYAGGGILSLAPYVARTATAIRVDTDESSPTTLTSDEYRLYPYPAWHGAVYTSVRLSPYLIHSRARWQQRLVEVTGTWGFATVPDDVAHACIVTTAIWLRRNVSAFSTTFNIDEARLERPEALPSEAVRILDPYRRVTYA